MELELEPIPLMPKQIALIAHDNRKRDLLEWAAFNQPVLAAHQLYATGTTGRLLERELGLAVTKFRSGPLGGDQQVGAKIADGELDMLVLWDIAVACNRTSADFIISSPLMRSSPRRQQGAA